MKNYFTEFFKFIHPEAFIWITGLMILAFINTDSTSHFTVCPFKAVGIKFCPGCGLGQSIHYLLHLQIERSLNTHPLGIFAFAVLVRRIIDLLIGSLPNKKTIFKTSTEYEYDQSFTINA